MNSIRVHSNTLYVSCIAIIWNHARERNLLVFLDAYVTLEINHVRVQ